MIENIFPLWFPFFSSSSTIVHTNSSSIDTNWNKWIKQKKRTTKQFRKWYQKKRLATRLFNKSMSLITESKSCKHSSHLSMPVVIHAMPFCVCDNFYVNALYSVDWWLLLYHLFPFVCLFFPVVIRRANVLADFISLRYRVAGAVRYGFA